jgi:hypothetical protein
LPSSTPEDVFPWDTSEKYKKLRDSEKDVAIMHRMIDLAKHSVARKLFRVPSTEQPDDEKGAD